jgi:hypothetical protein
MAVDINEGYDEIGESISKTKAYKQIVTDYEKLKKKFGKTFEKKTSKIAKRYNKIVKGITGTTQNYNKQVKDSSSQFDKLFEIKMMSVDEIINDNLKSKDPNKLKKYQKGNKVTKYIIGLFITSLNELKPKLLELLTEETLKAAGCSQDQTYTAGQTLYIRIPSIDYLGMLKVDPTSEVGQVIYEDKNLAYPGVPFSMNKELYNRTQNLNQAFSIQYASQYQGKSTQNLFDIEYVEQDNLGNNGSFFKVTPATRIGGNKVREFIKDYYTTINVIDFKNIFANLMNILTGAISISKGDGKGDLGEFYKVFLLMQRLLGLCFDGTKEIDVSGSSKVSDLNNLDDSFFEFTEIDLNFIDQQVSNVIQGVAEFTECDNVRLPIDPTAIISSINNLVFVPGSSNNNAIEDATNIMDSVTQNPNWLPLQIDLDFTYIKEFPKAVVYSVLSPKTILPLAIILKALGKNVLDQISSYVEFVKNFKEFYTNITTKIGATFMKILFNSIVKDIKKLVASTIKDIKSEKNKKRLAVILALTEIITTIAKVFSYDIRECKNVIQELQKFLKLISKRYSAGGNKIPLPLLMASKFLDGFSATRAHIETIGELQKLGIPTGPLPDGSPNEYVIAMKAIIDSIDKEEASNGQVQVACDGFSVTPIGITTPGFCFGKKM